MLTFGHFIAIGFGAAAGAISRWLLGLWLNHSGVLLPWGTLAANLTGGYLVGVMLGILALYPETPAWIKLMLVTGFLGGLTTFSTFSGETVGLLERGDYFPAFGYIVLSLVGSLALTFLGLATVNAWR
ncbi:fluoride efflux transporter CrcB [Candidimonas sp. SYP-B2681]|uniref:fluoride efflux transporter CrcB n=1 Tax=Candidimonas sp. SYP-B2681 TaxID=2497686 RepID=UPI000F8907A3|nr:fluoride efflux transporter CrcB [Candidimonas sp. SYP-B2681]RTZ44447.1 fluoride efflux transporter CrcB [Candidimonas sp. SYP-B2681]